MRRPWVWVDFENTPHVLFLEPIIRALREGGAAVTVTARPQAQTLDLAALRGFEVQPIGPGDLVGRTAKVIGATTRAVRLAAWARRAGRPVLLVSSSRTASLAAWLARVPAVGLLDYEHGENRPLELASRVLWLPDVLRDADLSRNTRRVARFYPGLKENLYLDTWAPDRDATRQTLGAGTSDYLVVARPPATTAHYSPAGSMGPWLAAIRALHGLSGVRILTMPRTPPQRAELAAALRGMECVRVLETTVVGPALVAAADLILGGGGTMNREAAVLGVPVWSAFTGPRPRIDEELAREGRLRWVRDATELAAALSGGLPERSAPRRPYPEGLRAIVSDIQNRL